MLAWLRAYHAVLWWMGALSVVMFVGTLIAVPMLVARIPPDYFSHPRRHDLQHPRPHSAMYILSLVLKNLLGLIFVVAGLAMLVLPGQGILTILLGLSLMNFPGKYALERRIARQPAVFKAINWMRAKANQPPLEAPAADPG